LFTSIVSRAIMVSGKRFEIDFNEGLSEENLKFLLFPKSM